MIYETNPNNDPGNWEFYNNHWFYLGEDPEGSKLERYFRDLQATA